MHDQPLASATCQECCRGSNSGEQRPHLEVHRWLAFWRGLQHVNLQTLADDAAGPGQQQQIPAWFMRGAFIRIRMVPLRTRGKMLCSSVIFLCNTVRCCGCSVRLNAVDAAACETVPQSLSAEAQF